METSTWNTISYFGNVVGIVAFFVQLTLLLQKSKKDREIQSLIKCMGDLALTKAGSWKTQINMSSQGNNPATDGELRIMVKASDEFIELANLSTALQGAVSSEISLSEENLKKLVAQTKLMEQLNESK